MTKERNQERFEHEEEGEKYQEGIEDNYKQFEMMKRLVDK